MLDIKDLQMPDSGPITVSVGRAGWKQVRHHDPANVLAALAGLEPVAGQVVLDGVDLHRLPPAARARAGLATAPGRLPPLPGMRVLDVLLLSRSLPLATAWRAAVGARRARAQVADAEAWARGLAGRLGIAQWVDETAAGLPPDIAALADVGRAVAAQPKAIAWQAPDWLTDEQTDGVAQVLRDEQAIGGWAVLELSGVPAPRRRGPLVLEITD